MITLTITAVQNVDYKINQVKDNDLVFKKQMEWEDQIFVYDTIEEKEMMIRAGDVSLYDHRLILGHNRYHILHFYSVG